MSKNIDLNAEKNKKNSNLHKAKTGKNDEFYTQLRDIENELKHYKSQFEWKVIFCNCDDPFESNFFKYFASNFNELGIKKLITTCYNKSPISGKQLALPWFSGNSEEKKWYKIELTEVKDENGDWSISIQDVKLFLEKNWSQMVELGEDGDFRSKECIKLLKQADIVVTNPPFSLFREYVAQLVEYEKKFLIIWNDNCRTYKEIFALIKENKFWCWYTHVKEFVKPDWTKQQFWNVSWYTNLDLEKRNESLILYKTYKGNEKDYPKYDNYDAIEVSKVADIPIDYDGVMGVPITFLDKYNPKQFEIVKFRKWDDEKDLIYTPIERERETSSTVFQDSDSSSSELIDMSKETQCQIRECTLVEKKSMQEWWLRDFEIIWQASWNTRASAPKEVLEQLKYEQHKEDRWGCALVDWIRKYNRVLIKRF